MVNRPLYGPSIKLNSSEAQRQQQMAQLLLKEGVDTSPVRGGWGEALARIGTAGIGGYLSNQAGETEKAYAADRAKTLAAALSGSDPNQAANTLLANPSTADLGTQLAVGNMTFNRDRAAKKEDFGMERGARLEDLYMTQGFQERLAKMQMAQQAGLADEARKHAVELQKMQQTFMGSEGDKNRQAQAAQQAAAAALAKVPQGYQVSPTGGVVPIPGSPQATEAADIAKTKAEQLVATDKMLRSIDDLIGAPAPIGSDPELIKARKEQASAREQGTGLSSYLNWVPGTAGRDFEANLDALKSQAFLPMVAQLKGMGALSDAEGKKLTQAIGALDSSMSEGAFLKSLNQIKADLTEARTRMSGGTPPPSAAPSSSLPPLPPGFNPLP